MDSSAVTSSPSSWPTATASGPSTSSSSTSGTRSTTPPRTSSATAPTRSTPTRSPTAPTRSTTSPPTWAAWASSRTTRPSACCRCSPAPTCSSPRATPAPSASSTAAPRASTTATKQQTADVTALTEADAYPADPEDGYGWEKLFSERMARHFREDFGLETRVARYHNVYGPHGSWEGGREKAPAALCRKVAQAKLSGDHTHRDLGRRRADPQLHVHRRLRPRHDGHPGRRQHRTGQPRIGRAGHDQPDGLDILEDIAGVTLERSHDLTRRRASAAATATTRCSARSTAGSRRSRWPTGLEATYRWIYDQLSARS